MPAQSQLFTLGQVRQIVGASVLRMRNLSSVAAYAIRPAQVTGAGPGERRLFDWWAVIRMAVAHLLFEYGFRPEEIGGALAALQPARAAHGDTKSWTLIREFAGWRVAAGAARPFDAEFGYFVLRLSPVLRVLETRRDAVLTGRNLEPQFDDVRIWQLTARGSRPARRKGN